MAEFCSVGVGQVEFEAEVKPLVCFFRRRGATSPFEEAGRVHPVVLWTGHCAAFREHCQAGAELLHSNGSPEWRQVGLSFAGSSAKDWEWTIIFIHITETS